MLLFVIVLLVGWYFFGFWATIFFGAFGVFSIFVYRNVYNTLHAEIEMLTTQIAQNELRYKKNIDDLRKQMPTFAKGSNFKESHREVFINVAEIASIRHLTVSNWGDARYLVILNNGIRYLFTDFDMRPYDYAHNSNNERK